jgi:tetratricopeptide (TPR) repeat protein
MLTLRLTQSNEGENKYRVEVSLEGDGLPRRMANSHFEFKLTGQDREDLRWYLEDYLQYPVDPAPKIAARIEMRMREIGTELFKKLFETNDDVRYLWATLYTHLNDTRVEIITGIEEATAIPWELIHDPKSDMPLALRVREFVRAHHQGIQPPKLPDMTRGPVRILLVICRPGGKDDVPFRSVASRLIKALGEHDLKFFKLDVLRPPTFESLGTVLRAAKNKNEPYHIVHFDGHGTYFDLEKFFEEETANVEDEMMDWLSELVTDSTRFSLRVIYPRPLRRGRHGYLAFENPSTEQNLRLVDGQELSGLLTESNVLVLVLNACRSAHAEVTPLPLLINSSDVNSHTQVRSFGCLAQEVIDAGVISVVAMRYNVYVVTAAQFVLHLYTTLILGESLGYSVTLGRKKLADNPLREIGCGPYPLQDWLVPVVYEAAPICLFPKTKKKRVSHHYVKSSGATRTEWNVHPNLPRGPDVGFFGRDETLLALDRCFDRHSMVLLHAWAGAGKTTTAAEFARWYSTTGGINGPVLFTSFQQYKPLARVLDEIERVFRDVLEQWDVQWLTLTDEERLSVSLRVLKKFPVLWIWDNVEPVMGFPAGTDSLWNSMERENLLNFLRDAGQTNSKFLLTSRHEERTWLGDLPARITMPPMPMQERVELARALAEKYGRQLTDVKHWYPLLRYTLGNPLAMVVLVGQALQDKLRTTEQFDTLLARLRTGEAVFEDEVDQGRGKSLGAALKYGFDQAFNQNQQKQLSLLYFFQGFVSVDALMWMADPKIGNLSELRGLTYEAAIALLDRAGAIGLVTPHGGGHYSTQPALTWFLKSYFDQHYAESKITATHAFVRALGWLGEFYFHEYERKHVRETIRLIEAEEENLLHAWRLARVNNWWDSVIGIMQGLRPLYSDTSRGSAWAKLLAQVVPDFINLQTDDPLPGREEYWSLITEYRINAETSAMRWVEAERLQRCLVARMRRLAPLDLISTATPHDRHAIRLLAIYLEHLGDILRMQKKRECVDAYNEAFNLHDLNGEKHTAVSLAFNLGNAYMEISDISDLDKAEQWYMHSFELSYDHLSQGKCLHELGHVAYIRFKKAQEANETSEQLAKFLNSAAQCNLQALDLLPSYLVKDLAAVNNSLGLILRDAGEIDRALQHFRRAARYAEEDGDMLHAAQIRVNIAITLVGADRLTDALEYAKSAKRDFEPYGQHASDMTEQTRKLIEHIEQNLNR